MKTYKKTRRYKQLFEMFTKEIEVRGGEINIVEKSKIKNLHVVEWDKHRQQMLLSVHGFRHYSNSTPNWSVTISYICGIDDSGPWAVRVPGTTETIKQAIDFLEPAKVKKARKVGRRVIRQGDIYAVETGNKKDRASQDDLPWTHTWYHRSRLLMHDGHVFANLFDPNNSESRTHGRSHAPVCIPFPCEFVQQTALVMGRNGGRGSAD